MEEYCRFSLNHPALAAKTKQLRHRLCDALAKLDSMKLLCSRDIVGDVGKDLKVDGQLSRKSIEDCFTAAAKRASEALRALAEASQAIDPNIASVMEKLRFEVYSLEKETVLKASAAEKFRNVHLYVLINVTPEIPENKMMDLARACIAGGADCLQLRAKKLSDKTLLNLAERFTSLCKDNSTISIINDRVDIAVLAGANGVHLGQNEIGLESARNLAKTPLILGSSTHLENELQQAIASGSDYIALGPAFASPTKPKLQTAGLDYLRKALPLLNEAGIFHVAIGGINQNNIESLLNIGIRTVAVSSAVCDSENPEKACNVLKNRLLK